MLFHLHYKGLFNQLQGILKVKLRSFILQNVSYTVVEEEQEVVIC